MGKLIQLPIAVGLALASPAFSQSAANFDTKKIVPAAPVTDKIKESKAPAAEGGSASVKPSRYVDEAGRESYLASLSSIFLMKGRPHDPFGQAQDPDAKPIIKATTSTVARRVAPVQVTPLSDIVKLIVVTTIMPADKQFLVGTRSFKQGDQIPLTFRNKPLRVQITEVTSRQIAFRNLDSGETAVRKLDMLPAGMSPGTQGIMAPGMVPDHPNAPIELGEAEPLSHR